MALCLKQKDQYDENTLCTDNISRRTKYIILTTDFDFRALRKQTLTPVHQDKKYGLKKLCNG